MGPLQQWPDCQGLNGQGGEPSPQHQQELVTRERGNCPSKENGRRENAGCGTPSSSRNRLVPAEKPGVEEGRVGVLVVPKAAAPPLRGASRAPHLSSLGLHPGQAHSLPAPGKGQDLHSSDRKTKAGDEKGPLAQHVLVTPQPEARQVLLPMTGRCWEETFPFLPPGLFGWSNN